MQTRKWAKCGKLPTYLFSHIYYFKIELSNFAHVDKICPQSRLFVLFCISPSRFFEKLRSFYYFFVHSICWREISSLISFFFFCCLYLCVHYFFAFFNLSWIFGCPNIVIEWTTFLVEIEFFMKKCIFNRHDGHSERQFHILFKYSLLWISVQNKNKNKLKKCDI